MATSVFLEVIWYIVLCAAAIFYVVLDGFDLGVGCLHLLAKNDNDRRIFLNAIGPVWDGNEVWLIAIGGALFAGFPPVYATLFSSFYTWIMVFLMGIIFRTVAIEFRSKLEAHSWRKVWDYVFAISSLIIAFGAGVLLANLITGIAIDGEQVFIGSFSSFFSVYSLAVGALGVLVFTVHGLFFLLLKTEGRLQEDVRSWFSPIYTLFISIYILVSILTASYAPHMIDRVLEYPLILIVPAITLGFVIWIPFLVRDKKDGLAFVSSSIVIALLFVLFSLETFPVLLRSSIDTAYNLTVYNASASNTTLTVLLVIACIGIPLVLAYGVILYRVFHGKVKLDHSSY